MERTITAGGKPYNIRASAGALIIYKSQFCREYPEELADIGDDENKAYTVGCRLLWAMAKSAREKLPSPDEWLRLFKKKELKEALLVSQLLFEISLGNGEKDRDGDDFSSEQLMASAALCGLGMDELNSLPLGMTIDTISRYMDMRYGGGDDEYVSSAEFFGE